MKIDCSKALEKAALFIENEAKLRCPVGDTGLLRASITHDVEGNEAVIGTNMEYAPYVEYGTGLFAEAGDGRQDVPWHYQTADGEWHSTYGQYPQPYLRPALDENLDELTKIMTRELKQSVELSIESEIGRLRIK